jgi:hypothetical protein
VIACPNCNRRVFTRRDIACAPLEGKVRCRFCGRSARLDLLSRWIILAVIALMMPALLLTWGVFYSGHLFMMMPALLLTWGVFYSGHLFMVSIAIILTAWGLLCLLCFPLMTLEPIEGSSLDRTHGTIMLVVLLIAAMLLDVYIASRFESEEALHKDQTAEEHRPS